MGVDEIPRLGDDVDRFMKTIENRARIYEGIDHGTLELELQRTAQHSKPKLRIGDIPIEYEGKTIVIHEVRNFHRIFAAYLKYKHALYQHDMQAAVGELLAGLDPLAAVNYQTVQANFEAINRLFVDFQPAYPNLFKVMERYAMYTDEIAQASNDFERDNPKLADIQLPPEDMRRMLVTFSAAIDGLGPIAERTGFDLSLFQG